MDRFEFLSDDWLSAFERTAQHLLHEGGPATGHSVRYAEIVNGVPADLNFGSTTAYMLAFCDGRAVVTRTGENDPAADCVVRIAYDAAMATMSLRSGLELDALSRKAFADGKMTMSGSPRDLPISMTSLHDALIDQTVV